MKKILTLATAIVMLSTFNSCRKCLDCRVDTPGASKPYYVKRACEGEAIYEASNGRAYFEYNSIEYHCYPAK